MSCTRPHKLHIGWIYFSFYLVLSSRQVFFRYAREWSPTVRGMPRLPNSKRMIRENRKSSRGWAWRMPLKTVIVLPVHETCHNRRGYTFKTNKQTGCSWLITKTWSTYLGKHNIQERRLFFFREGFWRTEEGMRKSVERITKHKKALRIYVHNITTIRNWKITWWNLTIGLQKFPAANMT